MKQQRFVVTGMNCGACSARVESVVSRLNGVKQVQVNLLTRSMLVHYNEALLSPAGIISAVQQAGYGASLPGGSQASTYQAERAAGRQFIFSLLLLLPLLLLHHILSGGLSLTLQAVLLLPLLYLNRIYFISGTRALLNRAPNMNTLIALGAAAAILYSAADAFFLHTGTIYLDSAGMILTIITLGKWLESRATARTGDALSQLKALLPEQAIISAAGQEIAIPAEEVRAGDLLIISPGARVPVDAEVLEGCSDIDESSLTGESIPATKRPGSKLYAGTVNGYGMLRASALCTRSESALSGIIALVGEAAAAKAPIARLADRVAGIFVPMVVSIAALTAGLWLLSGATAAFALGCAIAVLVISCPCALGLATPAAIMAGAGKGAEHGILFRDAAVMENARRTTAVVLDKTGTLTTGKPTVVQVSPATGIAETELLQLASTLEQGNRHPLAISIQNATANYRPEAAADIQYLPGRGICATVQGIPCAAGNASLMHELGIHLQPGITAGMTPVYVARGSEYMGMLLISDPIKPGSAAAVTAMQAAGLRVLIMSGDHAGAVQDAARKVGISEFHSGVTPRDKEAEVRRLQQQGHCVAMIGDGINDAPALSRADVGIAIGAGTDVAQNCAGIVLVRSELTDAVAALQLSKAIIRTIRQNLFWAFFYNVLAIPLAAGLYYPLLGWQLSPGVAAAAMSLSSLFVVCNALRLRHVSLPHPPEPTMITTTLHVEGMMCPHCERHVSQALSTLPGITAVTASHKDSSVTITSTASLDTALVAETIQKEGYVYKGTKQETPAS